MRKLLLGLKISGLTITGLILVAAIMATIRALLGRAKEIWSVSDVAVAESQAAAEGYPHRALVALDIFLNVLVLRGQQDETISAHAWRASLQGHLWGRALNGWLCWIQENHGQKAASGDLERARSVLLCYLRRLELPYDLFTLQCQVLRVSRVGMAEICLVLRRM